MKRISITIIIIITLLSIIPLSYVFAGSASCSGSNPTVCLASDIFSFIDQAPLVTLGKIISGLNDAFHFRDIPPNVFLGLLPLGLSDSFHFIDKSVQISLSSSLPNPFVTTVTTGTNNQLIDTSSIGGLIVTEIVLPIIYLLAVIIIMSKLGIKEFPIVLGISIFTFLGLIYIGVLPSWVIIMPIIFGGVALSLVASKWLGTRGGAEA